MKHAAFALGILVVIVLAVGSTHADRTRTVEPKQVPKQLVAGWSGEIPSLRQPQACAPVMQRVNDLTLTVGKLWETNPCVIPNHTGSYQRVARSATIRLLPGYPKPVKLRGDLVYVFLMPDGRYQVAARNHEYMECEGCTFNRGLETQPLFPSGAVPLATWGVNHQTKRPQWDSKGFPVFDQYVLELGAGIALAVESLPGKYLLQLDTASAPYRVVPPPRDSEAACDPGAVSTDLHYSYRCAYVRELYVRDGRPYRWTRTATEVKW